MTKAELIGAKMKIGITVAVAVLLMLGMAEPSFAQDNEEQLPWPITATWVMPGCRKVIEGHMNEDPLRAGICVGAAISNLARADICPPDDVTVSQATRIVVRYFEDTPMYQRESFAVVAWLALKEAWPCQEH